MKIFILIKPHDYTIAEAEVFRTRQEAEDAKNETGEKNYYWTIQEQEI